MIFGDGSVTRDFVYVLDVVAATVAALSTPVAGALNIGTGRETSVRKVVSRLIQVSGTGLDAELAPARPGEVSRACLDPGRAGRELGWKSQTPLDTGLAETYRHFADRARNAASAGSQAASTGRQ